MSMMNLSGLLHMPMMIKIDNALEQNHSIKS